MSSYPQWGDIKVKGDFLGDMVEEQGDFDLRGTVGKGIGNLEFGYYESADKDVYMRPNFNYRAPDNLALEVGANIFFGEYRNTFFAQFQDNTKMCVGLRCSF